MQSILNIVTIYKNEGEKSICANGQGISLLAAASKVLTKVILQRLIKNITPVLLPESQCGFRRMVDMMFMAQQLQEKCLVQNRDLLMASVNPSKAFVTDSRDLLLGVLLKFGCPVKFLDIHCQFHDGMMAEVAIVGHEYAPE